MINQRSGIDCMPGTWRVGFGEPAHWAEAGRTRILVVDDDRLTRDMLAAILEANGYAVVKACNGKEAFDRYVSDVSIDIIVSDVNMPVMGGIQLVKELRSINLGVPVIMVTSRRNILEVMNALICGAADYVFKDEIIQDSIIMAVRKACVMNGGMRTVSDVAVGSHV